jgi:hypothetical protein
MKHSRNKLTGSVIDSLTGNDSGLWSRDDSKSSIRVMLIVLGDSSRPALGSNINNQYTTALLSFNPYGSDHSE